MTRNRNPQGKLVMGLGDPEDMEFYKTGTFVYELGDGSHMAHTVTTGDDGRNVQVYIYAIDDVNDLDWASLNDLEGYYGEAIRDSFVMAERGDLDSKAVVFLAAGDVFGFDNLDGSPQRLTAREADDRYGDDIARFLSSRQRNPKGCGSGCGTPKPGAKPCCSACASKAPRRRVRRMANRNPEGKPVLQLGDIDPIEKDGMIVYEVSGGHMAHMFRDAGNGKVQISIFSIDDVDDLDFADVDEVDSYNGGYYRDDMAKAKAGSLSAKANMFMTVGYYYGFENLDSSPQVVKRSVAEKRYAKDLESLASAERVRNPSYEYDEWVEFFSGGADVGPYTKERVADFEDGVSEAVQAMLRKYPAREAPDEESLPYFVYATIVGHGVGIWDGRWDSLYPDANQAHWDKLGKFLGNYAYKGETLSNRAEELNSAFSFAEEYEESGKDYYDIEVPTWALVPLVNGDVSGITPEDEEKVDEFQSWLNGLDGDASPEYATESYFSSSPDFGDVRVEGSDVVKARVYLL